VSVGHGLMADELAQRHRTLGLGERFRFLGLRTDVLRLMAGADVFALPSHFEGLPVTLMEATSVGLPIVATRVGEIPNIFTDGSTALLVPPGRSDLFADAVERLVRDAPLRKQLSASSLELSKQFDVSSASRQVEQIYRDLLDTPS
jgi:glycosyltransferase involved in cell wall biosynthesis